MKNFTVKSHEKQPTNRAQGLDKLKEFAKKNDMILLGWSPKTLAQFVRGEKKLADLHGLSQDKLYEMAKVAYNLMNQGKLQEAGVIFKGLVALNPYDAYFHLALGAIAQRVGQNQEAENYYTRAIQINASLVSAYANRGEVRILLNKLNESIQDLMKAISLDPTGQDPSSNRCKVLMAAISYRINQIKTQNSSQSVG